MNLPVFLVGELWHMVFLHIREKPQRRVSHAHSIILPTYKYCEVLYVSLIIFKANPVILLTAGRDSRTVGDTKSRLPNSLYKSEQYSWPSISMVLHSLIQPMVGWFWPVIGWNSRMQSPQMQEGPTVNAVFVLGLEMELIILLHLLLSLFTHLYSYP